MEAPIVPQPFSSTGLMEKELRARGYALENFRLAGQAYLRAVAPNGWVLLTPRQFFTYPFTSAISHRISVDKDKAYALVERLGIGVPHTLVLPGASEADQQAFLKAYAPLVVKPVDGHGGNGVVMDITTRDQLQTAVQAALQESDRVLIQQQVIGGEVRITVLGGQVVSAIWRQTPRVTGDGTSTIAQLIADENEQRKALQFEYITYPLLDEHIVSRELLNDTRIPTTGEVVELGKSTMIKGGASFYNITDTLHQTYKDAAVRLTEQLDSAFMVVDMIIADHTQPMAEGNHAFIEFNTAPALRIYYGVRDGKVYDIVPKLADMIESAAAARI